MNVRELKAILERLQEVFSSAGSRQPARDLKSVVEVLEGSEGKTVEAFVAETKHLLEPGARPESQSTSDEAVIARYVRKLLDAGSDRDAFEAVLRALEDDEDIDKSRLFAIANGYFNEPTGGTHVFKFKSKTAAIEFMRKKFVERAQLESKFKIIERLTQGG
jgi:hypothetical protein